MDRDQRRRLAHAWSRLSMEERTAIARQWVGDLSTNYIDQIDAATREAHSALGKRTEAYSAILEGSSPKTGSRLDQLVSEVFIEGMHGDKHVCVHMEGNTSPRPIWVALWDPHVFACGRSCLPTPDPLETNTCDVCREPAYGMYGNELQWGPLIVVFGACVPCEVQLMNEYQGSP